MKVVHWLLTVAVAWWFRQDGAAAMCERQCGDVTVPYPFGIRINCARSPDFLLSCANFEGSGFRLQLGNLIIHDISTRDSTMVVSLPEAYGAYQCYDQNGKPAKKSSPVVIDLFPHTRYRFSETLNKLTVIVSETLNKLTVIGCDTMAVVANTAGTFGNGCVSYCGNTDANMTTCSGQGCCQASIPRGLTLNISISSLNRNASPFQVGHCARAFVADNRSFNISNWTPPRFEDVGNTPRLVLDWMIKSRCNMTQRNKSSYACGRFAKCKDFGNEQGYRCACNDGYEGNPYDRLKGCQDIDECKDPKKYPCRGKCKNTLGSYACRCRFGMQGNARVPCQISPWVIVVSAIIGALFFMAVGTLLFAKWQRRRIKNKNFNRNRGELLKHQRVQIFTEAELAKSTNNYADSNKLGEGGFGSVYKARIVGDIVVAVKKPKDVHKSLLKGDFQHELQIVMQINHKNVVKLHGICLETRIPLLVYEYISNGTLFQHIHQNASTILESWKNRLRIAAEVALALEYMHSCAEPPIIHGDIKSVNILLDQNYSVKVSDFGTSVLISPECSHVVNNEIQGTLGYIDPEYLTTGILTIKSDVYSFGVVLVELLTGKKPTSFITKSEESINIIHYFISSVKDKTLSEVISFDVATEDEMERAGMVAEVAAKCLDPSGARRPAMREVAEQLAKINREFDSSTIEENNEETESMVDEENLYSHAISTTSGMSQHGTTSSLFYSAGSSI